MSKRIIGILIVVAILLTGCGAGKSGNDETSPTNNQEEQNQQPQQLLSKQYHGFDLEKMKPDMGGEEYNSDAEFDMAIQGKVTARCYGEYIGRVSTYDEDTVYANKVFDYCKSISDDGKVYQSVGRFKDPNSANVKEVKSVKAAEEISNTYTWSIKLDGYWYVITIAGDKARLNDSIGVRIVQLAKC